MTVDADPTAWLNQTRRARAYRILWIRPIRSSLYLYGRASLLAGNTEEARRAFEAAITRADLESLTGKRDPEKGSDVRIGRRGAQVRKRQTRRPTRFDEVMKRTPLFSSRATARRSSPKLAAYRGSRPHER